MVAISHKSPHLRLTPPDIIDPGEPLQSAFNPGQRKIFATLRTSLIIDPKSKRILREFLLRDQFGNYWLTYLGHCIDFEAYQHPVDRTAHLKPIAGIKEHGGITADLMDKHRLAAFGGFAQLDRDISAARARADSATPATLASAPLITATA